MSEQQPMYRVYTLIERPRDDPFWLNIGVAFFHKDTKGLNVILQALPLDGKLVLRRYEEPQPEETGEKPPRTKKKADQPPEQA